MKLTRRLAILAVAVLGIFLTHAQVAPTPPVDSVDRLTPRVLIFTKTAGFRHDSIPVGIKAIETLCDAQGIETAATEDASLFNDEALKPFHAVVFLNTTGDVLDDAQQEALRRFIQRGGGFVGIHSATDTEYDWPWYGQLVGARFNGHPKIQHATIHIADPAHPATAGLPNPWNVRDEWYNFKEVKPHLHVLCNLDETSYEGGDMGAAHPIAWIREFEGGRVFYTGLGHTPEMFRDGAFIAHLGGGLRWVVRMGGH